MRARPKGVGRAATAIAVVVATGLSAFAGESRAPRPPAAASGTEPTVLPAPVPPEPRPMRVLLVRDDGDCGTTCAEWISAEGDFVDATPEVFRKFFRTVGDRSLPILFHSRGGSTSAAMEVGRILRRRQALVAVGRTILPGCLAPGAACEPARPNTPLAGEPAMSGVCLSACVFAFAGGTTRVAGRAARVGVHQASVAGQVSKRWRIRYKVGPDGDRVEVGRELIDETRIKVTPRALGEGDPFYARVTAYFRGLGVGDRLVALSAATPAATIRLLTPAELEETKLVTRDGGLESVLPATRIVHFVRPLPNPDGTPADAYRPIVPVGLLAAAKIGFEDGGEVTLHFDTLYGSPTIGWRAAIERAGLPATAVIIRLRTTTAERVFGGGVLRPPRRPSDSPLPMEQLSVSDFCGIAAAPMSVFQLAYRPAPGAAVLEKSATVGPLGDLARLRAFVCRQAAPPPPPPAERPAEKPRKATTTRS
jgi:hypothetical protein